MALPHAKTKDKATKIQTTLYYRGNNKQAKAESGISLKLRGKGETNYSVSVIKKTGYLYDYP